MRTQQIKRNYWGPIRQFQVPCNIFKRDQLIVGPNALAVLLTLYETAKNRKATDKQEFASLVISQKRLIERTGYSKNVITKAVRELEAASFIRASAGDRRKYGEFGVNRYVLCDPQTSEPLRVVPGLRLLYGNAISYFNLPVCIVQESVPHWSIAKLTGSELVLYVALVYCANRKGQSELAIVPSDLRRLCHLSQPTFKKAIAELQQRGLILADETTQVLCDPYTGEPLHKFTGDSEDDPSNYYERMGDRIGKRANLNLEAEETERWILACLSPDAFIVPQGNGDFKICCPFHKDDNPSCSVSPRKRCFYCFGCKAKGTLTTLVMKVNGVSKREAIQKKANVAGLELEFHDKDYKAEAKYDYYNAAGKLEKQVVRFPGKKFAQRRFGPGGWIWNVRDVKPLLYNLLRMKLAQTVCITEGEKDADRITNLGLRDVNGSEIVATTSGGADSWVDSLAQSLQHKRVIVMPDADEAGQKYAKQVVESLKKLNIEHRVITFNDVGAKDVSEFLDSGHTNDEILERIGADWVQLESCAVVDDGIQI